MTRRLITEDELADRIEAEKYDFDPDREFGVEDLDTLTSEELFALDLQPPPMVVPGLIAQGLNILGGNPKSGKSWAALQLAHAVATGGFFLGQKVDRGQVLYLALEDTLYRLKHRMTGIGLPPTPGLHFATESRSLKTGGLEAIWSFIHRHAETKLVIIDTLGRMKDASVGGGNAYETDTQLGGALQKFSFAGEIGLVLVHHMSKTGHKDFLLSMSGSAGLPGTADVVLGLERERNAPDAHLHVTGRDIDEKTMALEWGSRGWNVPEYAAEYEDYDRRYN